MRVAQEHTITVTDLPEQDRFQATDESGVVAGFLAYERRDDLVVLVHTEVDDAFEGRGVGSTLVRQVLEKLQAEGARIQPDCRFVRSYLERHPEYQHLVRRGDKGGPEL